MLKNVAISDSPKASCRGLDLLAGCGSLTSVDIKPGICELFAYRQRREGHPNPATVVCADIMADTLPSSNGWTTSSRAGTSSGRERKTRDPGSERERGRRSVEYQQIITGGGEDIGQ